ncbi:MAG TPA: metallophosphoesterase [Actinomycetota bacterium]|nr:metallophosphoesterase [Actinomycetota bacterium]
MHPVVRVAVVVVLGAAAGLVAVGVAPAARGPVGPGTVEVRGRLGSPRTDLRLPPLGRISAPTHRPPLRLSLLVERVDLEDLQEVLRDSSRQRRLREQVTRDLGLLLRDFAVRAVLASLAAGILLGALVPGRRPWMMAAGAAGGVLAAALVLGGSWRTFDESAFARATFEGPIEEAPRVLEAARRHFEGIGDVRKRLRVLGDRVAQLYEATSTDESTTVGQTRILHVSDVHSNPVALEMVERLAAGFRVEAVLDTGDLTSFGSPVEARIGDLIARVGKPYLFVPGNHDSPDNRASLAAVPGVQVLDGTVAQVGEVRVMGFADPTFTARNDVSSSEARAAKTAKAREVAEVVAGQLPDVVAVHDRLLASRVDDVPLVVAGHVHRRSSARKGTVRTLTVGSTGATGLGSFAVEADRPYEAQILTFSGSTLASIDYVTLRGLGGNFVVERTLIEPQSLPR